MKIAKQRNINDDLIRALAMIMVIFIHAGFDSAVTNPLLNALVTTVISSANCFFFMLSGKYNLSKTFNTPQDYLSFYKGKLINIVFPYFTVSILLSLWNMKYIPDMTISFRSWALFALKEFFSANSGTHMWFMFPLLGYILSAPFLSKMLHAMSDAELNILFAVGILWNIVTIYLFMDLGHDFSYNGWILSGWLLCFVSGYYLSRVATIKPLSKVTIILLIAGGIGLLINTLGLFIFGSGYHSGTDYAPAFILSSIALYLALLFIPVSSDTPFSAVILFVARHSFTVYLIHFNILNHIVVKYVNPADPVLCYFARALITLCISLPIAAVIDILFFDPCKKLFKKFAFKS